jgi:hypothetical protein
MSTTRKRKCQASDQPCSTGILFLRRKAPVEIKDGLVVELLGLKWLARVDMGELVLTQHVSRDNKREKAQERRMDRKNEIELRIMEATALQAQVVASTERLAQVRVD